MIRRRPQSAIARRFLARAEQLEQRTVLNGTPVATDNAYDANEDTVLVGNLLSDDTGNGIDSPATAVALGVEGNLLPIGGQVELASGATLQVAADGQFSYDPSTATSLNALAGGESATDTFQYTISGGFSEMFVFGDSLSDDGNLSALTGGAFPPDPPYFGGRSAGGPVWPEYLAPRLNIAPENVHNFAVLGAGTGRNNFNEDRLGFDLPGVLDEVDQFLAQLGTGPADADALYVVWAGPNDFFDPPADPQAAIAESITNLVTTIGTLQAVGAQHIVVPNMPDLGATPFAISLGVGELLTTFSIGFNAALEATIAGHGLDVIEFDSFEFFAGLVPQAEDLGLTNITEPCFNEATFSLCSTPSEYAYWDTVHPTTRVHELLAHSMLAELSTNAPLNQTDTATVTIDVAGATTIPTAFVTGPGETVPGHTVTFELSAADAAEADQNGQFNYHIDFNDGSPAEHLTGGANGVVVSHAFTELGDFQIDVTATDHDGDTSIAATHDITVEPAILSGGDLLVGGTNASDRIVFRETGTQTVWVQVNRHRQAFDLDSDARIVAYGLAGNDTISAGNVGYPVEFYGGLGNDYLRGTDNDDLLSGGAGNDLILGGDGDNLLTGGDGRDRIRGGDGDDSIEGGLGNDFLTGGRGDDQILGGEGHDLIFGGQGEDYLAGGAGRDFILGGAHADQILGELGNDQLFGGDGDDEIDGGEGFDLIFGGPGLDELLNGERVFG